jgi:hypothetical protein
MHPSGNAFYRNRAVRNARAGGMDIAGKKRFYGGPSWGDCN